MEHLTNDELARIAMFPLPKVVLFPGALIPLHIFEPRYREMTRDVLDSTKLLAITAFADHEEKGFEEDQRPTVRPIVGLGRIIASNETNDGRYNIVVRGVARAEIVEELPPVMAYRQIRATVLPDTAPSAPNTLAEQQRLLITLCERIATELPHGGDELCKMIHETKSPGECANLVAATLVPESEDRYALLTNLDPSARIEITLEHLASILSRLIPPPEYLN